MQRAEKGRLKDTGKTSLQADRRHVICFSSESEGLSIFGCRKRLCRLSVGR